MMIEQLRNGRLAIVASIACHDKFTCGGK